jgi:quercetin dioxygenase-like cupin family protein
MELWADGVVTPAPAGSVVYVAYGTSHFLKNVGEGPARYFVFQVGGDTKKG